MASFRIAAANGAQTFELTRNLSGTWQIGVQFFEPPSAGSMSIDYMLNGESEWRAAPLGADIDLTDPQSVYVFGYIRRLRLTIAGLSGGGGGGFLFAQPGTPLGFMPQHFTDGLGANSRLLVDQGQTGFFAGREFRTFRQFTLLQGAVLVIKVVCPVDVILHALQTFLDSGHIDVETVIGGTPGGSFSETLPVLPRNTMSDRPTPIYSAQVVATAGGTLTGGTVLDIFSNKTADKTSEVVSHDVSLQEGRGLGAGTYYVRTTAVAASSGTLKASWEERPGGGL